MRQADFDQHLVPSISALSPGTNGQPGELCDCCVEDAGPEGGSRYRLWEIDAGSHCSIIGTCLTIEELRQITRKAGLVITEHSHDYDVHGYFVSQSSARSQLSKLVHKTLERKYAGQVARFRRCETPAEMWAHWRQAMESGDIAGAYWAVMSNRSASLDIRIRAHNEVHMLSHLLGKSNRADIKRLRQLEQDNAALAERMEKSRSRGEALVQERDKRIRELEQQVTDARMVAAIIPPPAAGQRPRQEMAPEKWRARLMTLERRIRAERARARAAERQLDMLKRAGTLRVQQASLPHQPSVEENGRDVNLGGQTLLYVGGYRDVVPQLRAHVENCQGRFLYHDGGVEMQTAKLPGLVSQAQLIFCPVVCVSHDACLRLKHLCRQQNKPFVLLRSAGLSGFVSALTDQGGTVRQGTSSRPPSRNDGPAVAVLSAPPLASHP